MIGSIAVPARSNKLLTGLPAISTAVFTTLTIASGGRGIRRTGPSGSPNQKSSAALVVSSPPCDPYTRHYCGESSDILGETWVAASLEWIRLTTLVQDCISVTATSLAAPLVTATVRPLNVAWVGRWEAVVGGQLLARNGREFRKPIVNAALFCFRIRMQGRGPWGRVSLKAERALSASRRQFGGCVVERLWLDPASRPHHQSVWESVWGAWPLGARIFDAQRNGGVRGFRWTYGWTELSLSSARQERRVVPPNVSWIDVAAEVSIPPWRIFVNSRLIESIMEHGASNIYPEFCWWRGAIPEQGPWL